VAVATRTSEPTVFQQAWAASEVVVQEDSIQPARLASTGLVEVVEVVEVVTPATTSTAEATVVTAS
jgi:hypothetical protein